MSRSAGILSLLMIDIDHFKNYNDAYGHSEGDRCLIIIAETLAENITRQEDFVARYGGEEFVVVLPDTDESGAQMVADKMIESIRRLRLPHKQSGVADHVTISIGVTTGSVKHTQSGVDYVKQADKSLYLSKQNGRDRCTFLGMP